MANLTREIDILDLKLRIQYLERTIKQFKDLEYEAPIEMVRELKEKNNILNGNNN